ncbi:ankyrin repeat domain-containing protein [Thauera butanivorans]|uniref:ankyrin repeat domain-containing protein n=1 Tax=Thauera butanivorans TaxID=86174 RepID=UPI00083825A6|nr:ankyrin repeat domain-containing protein [Thauera butanivorans]
MSLLARLLAALLALGLLTACERPAWDKDRNMDIMHFGAFKVELPLEFPDPEQRAFVLAVLEGRVHVLDPDSVRHLIDRPGATYHLTPLILAVRNKQHTSARWLLEHGADPNYHVPAWPRGRNPLQKRSPLFYAVNLGDLRMATLLFDFGADPNQKGLVYPIFFETMDLGRGDGPLFRLFIERGADIDLRDKPPYGRSVLTYAGTRGHCEAALHLIGLGADVHARTRIRLGGRFRMNNPVEDDWMYIHLLAAALNGIDLKETRNEGRCYARLKRAFIERGIRFPQFDDRLLSRWLRAKTDITEALLREHGADDDTVRRVLKWYDEEVLPPMPGRQIGRWLNDGVPFTEQMLREIGANDEQVLQALDRQEIWKLPEHGRRKYWKIDDWLRDGVPITEQMLREIGADQQQIDNALARQEIHRRYRPPSPRE